MESHAVNHEAVILITSIGEIVMCGDIMETSLATIW